MGISLKVHKMLWGKSGNMCAFPSCKENLVSEETLQDTAAIIGEEAHIIAQSEDGARGKSTLSLEERNSYENLILLCRKHHKIIDDQENEYTVEKLQEMKENHEKWVKENLSQDKFKITDDEIYAIYIDEFARITNLDAWQNWASTVIIDDFFSIEAFEGIKQIPDYINSRIWLKKYEPLEEALINFKNIVTDLLIIYDKYPNKTAHGYYIDKFYKKYQIENMRNNYCEKKERMAVLKYEYHTYLIADLMIELTRAANYVCNQTRKFIFNGFRIKEGSVLVNIGNKLVKPEYRNYPYKEFPYTGLRKFMEQRTTRDVYLGQGIEEDYFTH